MSLSESILKFAESTHRGTDGAEYDSKQRKRVQNRLNQRARRNRLKDVQGGNKVKTEEHTQLTDRWRLDELQFLQKPKRSGSLVKASHADVTPPSGKHARSKSPVCNPLEIVIHRAMEESDPLPCNTLRRNIRPWAPFADQLLHLVTFNVLTGVCLNKHLLSRVTTYLVTGPIHTEHIDIMKWLPKQSILIPKEVDQPISLLPTSLQMTQFHAPWIDFIPFPDLRDNLIRNHENFDHWAFLKDVIGDMLDASMFYRPEQYKDIPLFAQGWKPGFEDEVEEDRKGLILWAEPYRPQSWEATPGFLKRWGWLAKGCSELIDVSNQWRRIRGEEPLVMES